jgi:hypothetical protein
MDWWLEMALVQQLRAYVDWLREIANNSSTPEAHRQEMLKMAHAFELYARLRELNRTADSTELARRRRPRLQTDEVP